MSAFPFTLIYTSHRKVHIRISPQGELVFTIPQRYKNDEKFLHQLFEHADKMWQRYQKRTIVKKWDAEGIQLFGEFVTWEEFFTSLGTTRRFDSANTKRLEKQLKEILYEYAKEHLDKFSADVGTPYQSLTIRKATSRWGSCSSHQKIMLSLSLVFLPREYIKYVIAHEAAHLVEKNHSKAFWALVEKLFPDCQSVRKSLNTFII
jgi:predicted metal-dependent hydrolase